MSNKVDRFQRSEIPYRRIAEAISDVIFVTDKANRFLYVSPSVGNYLGYSSSELIGQDSIDFLHGDDQAKARQRTMDTVTREPSSIEYQIRAKNGDYRWFRAASQPYYESGKAVGRYGVLSDITEQKKAEIKLRESEEKYRSIMEAFTDPLCIRAPDLTVQYMNPAMIQKIGRDATGESCHHALHGLCGNFEWCVSNNAELDETVETNILSPRDNRNYRVKMMPFRNPDGRVSKMTVFRDITDYLTAIKEKQRAQTQLVQAQKMESIGNLAGGIAHDFNNILAAMIGFAELALDEVEEGTAVEDDLQEIYAAGKRAKELVKHILAFARQSEEAVTPLQPGAIAKELTKFIRSTTPTTIEIVPRIESDAFIMGNATEVHQILMNLCTNAVHAMENTGGILGISVKDIAADKIAEIAKHKLKSEDHIELKVSDTGAGIPAHMINSIFDPYFTTKSPGEGTGLGLSVVHGIVESYGGMIKVDSTVGKGTTFAVYLPITKERRQSPLNSRAVLPSGNERILFVDDEAPIAKMGQQMLASLGYKTITSVSSLDALELFKSKYKEIDLVVTDMTMPNMPGDKLAVEMMKIRPDIPVILCTGYSKKISAVAASKIGIRALVYKPIVRADIAETIRRVLDDARSSLHDDGD